MTVSLPEELLREIRILAAERDTSISAMLVQALREIADCETGYDEARRGMLADLRKGYRLGTQGKITWTRESLYER
ncbi:MAG: ribbon-helix-helix protein, CopG family [Bryobacteraceae bacterium]